jgi:hypothetical protein
LNQNLPSEDEEPELKTTAWFPGHVKPVHTGTYEVQVAPSPAWPFPSEAMYKWTGKKWSDVDGNTVKQVVQWRGLIEKVE